MDPVVSGFSFSCEFWGFVKFLWLATRFLANSKTHPMGTHPFQRVSSKHWGCPNPQLSYCVTCGGNYYAENIWRWSGMTSALCSFNGHQLGCPRNLVPIKEFLSWLITTYFSDLQPTLQGLFQQPRSDVRDPNALHIFLVLGLPWENPLACSIEAMLPLQWFQIT